MVRWCFLRCRFGNEMDILCWNLGINEEPTCIYIRNRTTIRKQIVPCFNLQARAHISQCRKESIATVRQIFKPNMLAYFRNIFFAAIKNSPVFLAARKPSYMCLFWQSNFLWIFFLFFSTVRWAGGWVEFHQLPRGGRDGKRLHAENGRLKLFLYFACVLQVEFILDSRGAVARWLKG